MNISEESDFVVYTAGAGITIDGNVVKADIGLTSSQVAAGNHTHANYAAANHTHDYSNTYASKSHTHSDYVTYDDFDAAIEATAEVNHTHTVSDITNFPTIPEISSSSSNISSSSAYLVTGGAIHAKYGDKATSSSSITSGNTDLVTGGAVYAYLQSISSNSGNNTTNDTNTWREIQVNGSRVHSTNISSGAVNFTGSVSIGQNNEIVIGGSSNLSALLNTAFPSASPGDVIKYYAEYDNNNQYQQGWRTGRVSVEELANVSNGPSGADQVFICSSYNSNGSNSYGFRQVASSYSSIASGNTDIVTGDAVYNYIQNLSLGSGNSSSNNNTNQGSNNYLELNITVSNHSVHDIFTLAENDIVVGHLYCLNITNHCHTIIEVLVDNSSSGGESFTNLYGPALNNDNGNGVSLSSYTSGNSERYIAFTSLPDGEWKLGFRYTVYRAPQSNS